MDLLQVCENLNRFFVQGGNPGIEAIGDAGSVWIIMPARENPNEIEYGLSPYIVDKATGVVRCFSVVSDEDWELIDQAVSVEVPEKYKPIYN